MQTVAKWLAVSWVLKSSYAGMFIIMLIEGPVVTAFGGFGAKLGFFNVWFVLLLSALGNFLPDLFFYGIGYYGQAWDNR
jgi:membrane protein DedA with SNARE-associated domain